MKSSVFIITGGTGGHVIPAVNFFNYIDSKTENVYLLTDKRGSKYIKNINENNIFKIHSSHLSGNIFFKLKAIIKLLFGFFQSIIIFMKLKPKIVISFGSYASLTPLICFIIFKIFFKTKLYLHEQNSIIGQTNRTFIKFSNKIFMNFDKNYYSINKYFEKISIVGLPQKIIKKSFKKDYNKTSDIFNFLVFAGSQGSEEIIILLKKIINNLQIKKELKKIKFFIQSPSNKHQEIESLLIKYNYDYEIQNFYDNFETILKKANLAFCRSGAGTINDLINFKIPAIICPLSSAKDNHQYENAKILTDINCGIILDDKKINIEEIILFIEKVFKDNNFKKSVLNNYSKIKLENASELMWKIIADDKQ